MMKKVAAIFILIFLLPSMLLAKRDHPERWYQVHWCKAHTGQIEVVLPDGTRCDCLTDTHAIEFDFGSNWPRLSDKVRITDYKLAKKQELCWY